MKALAIKMILDEMKMKRGSLFPWAHIKFQHDPELMKLPWGVTKITCDPEK